MCKEGTPEMEAIVSVLERAGWYLSLIRPMDVLDVAIIAYLVYKTLCLVRRISSSAWRSFWWPCGCRPRRP